MTDPYFIQRGTRVGFLALVALPALFCATTSVRGQEALRISTQGDQAAATEQQDQNSIDYYNLLLGPLAWRFATGLQLEYNDNVQLQSQKPESDFIFRPNVNAQMNWPITEVNNLNLSVQAGYSEYVQHGNLDQFYVNPGSGLSFNVYVGDFVINIHDQISISDEAYQNQSANGSTSYSTLQNTAGINTMWNLNKAEITVGYDHANYVTLNSSQVLPDASSDNFFINGGLRPIPQVLAGLEAGGGLIDYSSTGATNSITNPNATQWNLGAFSTATISEYLSARVDAGYTMLVPDVTTTNFSSSAGSGFYVQLLLTHEVNQYFNYSLSARRTIDLQYDGQPYDRYNVRWEPNWNCFKGFAVSTPVWWEHGTEVYYQSATYDQYGVGISIGRQITQKLSGSITYQYVKETSPQQSLNYTDDIVSLNLSYKF